jgi:hypothetical protein
MKVSAWVVVATVAVLLAPSTVHAQDLDSVKSVSRYLSCTASLPCTNAFLFEPIDVQSGPLGENPKGRLSIHFGGSAGPTYTGTATCLAVNGNRATIGFAGAVRAIGPFPPEYFVAALYLTDNGPAPLREFSDLPEFFPDRVDFEQLATVPRDCASLPPPSNRAQHEYGDVAIHDAVTSTTPPPIQDSVTGFARRADLDPDSWIDIDIDSRSGPSGENPIGSAWHSGSVDPSRRIGGPVTCLAVNGRSAAVTFDISQSNNSGNRFLKAHVVDNTGTGQPDQFALSPPSVENPGCAINPLPAGSSITAGDITVVDAKPKPRFFTLDDCRLGGWAKIGFTSRRQCGNFVRWQCRDGRHSYYGFPTIYHCRQAINS